MADITYRVKGDYLIPELILYGEGYENCPEEEIGRYGELRERFLREHSAWDIYGNALDGKPCDPSARDR